MGLVNQRMSYQSICGLFWHPLSLDNVYKGSCVSVTVSFPTGLSFSLPQVFGITTGRLQYTFPMHCTIQFFSNSSVVFFPAYLPSSLYSIAYTALRSSFDRSRNTPKCWIRVRSWQRMCGIDNDGLWSMIPFNGDAYRFIDEQSLKDHCPSVAAFWTWSMNWDR